MVRDQSADREITGHLPPRNLPDERSHPLPLTGTGGCWSDGSCHRWGVCPSPEVQVGGRSVLPPTTSINDGTVIRGYRLMIENTSKDAWLLMAKMRRCYT